jgi:hypothetical protein
VKEPNRDMSFGEIRRERQRLPCHFACFHQLHFAQWIGQPMTPQVADRQLRDG